MEIPLLLLLLLLLLSSFFAFPIHCTPTPIPVQFNAHHFTNSPSLSHSLNESQEYIQVTHPLPSDHLTSSCSSSLLTHSFAYSYGDPPVTALYSPPPNCTWSHAVLEFHVYSKGQQYDRISGVWLEGVELLRTSTAEPNDYGVFWNVRKDVTRYSSLLQRSNLTLAVMLENLVNDEFTGVYHVNVSVIYYDDKVVRFPSPGLASFIKPIRKLGYGKSEVESEKFLRNQVNKPDESSRKLMNAYQKPADLIVPVSGNVSEELWFRIKNNSDVYTRGIQIPPNTMKAMLEVYVSFHGDDEFWYSNPPYSYIEANNLTSGRANGAFREVFVTIDGNLVGSVIPFPVIFTGGINPLFWEPVVAIGAFDLPSYDFDLTPFLGYLLDGKSHLFGLGVTDSISFWLVDANLHLWLDSGSVQVQAKVVEFKIPPLKIERKSEFQQLDGSFKIKVKRKSSIVSWVNSSAGNLTTDFSEKIKFKNVIKFQNNGAVKLVEEEVEIKTKVKIETDTGDSVSKTKVKRKYPLRLSITNLPKSENDTYVVVTTIVHGLKDKYSEGDISRSLDTTQNATGWMLVKDHSVLSGAAQSYQTYDYEDEFGCYSRIVSSSNGRVVADDTSAPCAALY